MKVQAGKKVVGGALDLATRQAANKARKKAARKASKVRRKENLAEWVESLGSKNKPRGMNLEYKLNDTPIGEIQDYRSKQLGFFSDNNKPAKRLHRLYDRLEDVGADPITFELVPGGDDIVKPSLNRAGASGRAKAFSRADVENLRKLSAGQPITDEHIRAYRAAQNMIPDRLDDFVVAAGKIDMPFRDLLKFFAMGVF
jgi:hypothetical protein